MYHLWQVDKGHKLPLGEPQLMTSFTEASQLDLNKLSKERDEKFGLDSTHKKELRAGIQEPQVHPDADSAWAKK